MDNQIYAGDSVPVDILNKWLASSGKNLYINEVGEKRWRVAQTGRYIGTALGDTRVINARAIMDGQTCFNITGNNGQRDYWIKEEGFLDFLYKETGLHLPKKGTSPETKKQEFVSPIKENGKYKIWIGDDKELHTKVYNRLVELGQPAHKTVSKEKRNAIYIYKNGNLAHTNNRHFFDKQSNDYIELKVSDLWPVGIYKENTQLINHITTKTDGKVINVPRKAATITGGEKPTGSKISSKTSFTTITVGHLSNRAVSRSSQGEVREYNDYEPF